MLRSLAVARGCAFIDRSPSAAADPARAATTYWVNQYAVAPDQPGGTRHHEMAGALRRLGHDVRVVASDLNLSSRSYSRRVDGNDTRHLQEEVDGVPFVWLPAGRYERNDWRRAASMLVFAWHVFIYLLRTVRRGDVVIGSSPHLLAAAAARAAALLRRASFVLEIRDLWPESYTGVSGRGGPLTVAMRAIADALYRSSGAIIILARGSRDPIVAHGGPPKRIVYIPNGVSLTGSAASQATSLPRELEEVLAHPTFVYAGAHGPANGLDLVLDAAETVRAEGDDAARILLIGDGPSKADLMAAAAQRNLDNVVFHPPVPKQMIPHILRRCTGGLMVLKDVELFRYGVSPNKLFDYLAADLPVVTNVPGDVSDIVRQANAGIVVPPGDAAALAHAMRELVRGNLDIAPGSAYVREHHDRDRLAERLGWAIDRVRSA